MIKEVSFEEACRHDKACCSPANTPECRRLLAGDGRHFAMLCRIAGTDTMHGVSQNNYKFFVEV